MTKSEISSVLKTCAPVIFGYLPTGFAFGLMMTENGYSFLTAALMSVFIYAGAGQYMAVTLLTGGASFFRIALTIFLVNSKHLFYGLSLLGEYRRLGVGKLYRVFALTDETYALLTAPKNKLRPDFRQFSLRVSAVNQSAWIIGTLAGALFGSVIKFDSRGMDFAMTALFIIILIEQLKAHKTKLPFLIGFACAVVALVFFGKANVLLIGVLMSGFMLIILRKFVEKGETGEAES